MAKRPPNFDAPAYDPMTGEVITEQGAATFRRSWQKGKRAPGTYEASFEYEGAKVYFNGLSPSQWKRFEDRQKELGKKRQSLEDEITARVELEQKKIKQRQNAKVTLTPEQIEAERSESALVGEAWKTRKSDLDSQLLDSLRSLIAETVVGWESAPIPYEPGAIDELPEEILADWTQNIVELSSLTQKEADFLAGSSPK